MAAPVCRLTPDTRPPAPDSRHLAPRFGTMRELIARLDGDRGWSETPAEEAAAAQRAAFRHGQCRGEVVMVDQATRYDPAGAVLMLLIASEAGLLVRAPLTRAAVAALLDFVRNEGSVR